jgi:hypothetical protein
LRNTVLGENVTPQLATRTILAHLGQGLIDKKLESALGKNGGNGRKFPIMQRANPVAGGD